MAIFPLQLVLASLAETPVQRQEQTKNKSRCAITAQTIYRASVIAS